MSCCVSSAPHPGAKALSFFSTFLLTSQTVRLTRGTHVTVALYLPRLFEHGEIVERGTLLARGGRYRQLYDKQYNFERDQFINPGEDFTTPTPEEAKVPSTLRANDAL